MRNFLFAGSLLIADGETSDAEIIVFEEFFGKHKYHEALDLEKLEKDVPSAQSTRTISAGARTVSTTGAGRT